MSDITNKYSDSYGTKVVILLSMFLRSTFLVLIFLASPYFAYADSCVESLVKIEKISALDRYYNWVSELQYIKEERLEQTKMMQQRALDDRKVAADIIKKNKSHNNKSTSGDSIAEPSRGLVYDPNVSWAATQFLFSRYGATTVEEVKVTSLNDLKLFLQNELPKKISKIAIETIDAFNNETKVFNWISELRQDQLTAIFNDGLNLKAATAPLLRQQYLDEVLAARAPNVGLHTAETGLPVDMVTMGAKSFFKTLSKKEIFIDWTGTTLVQGTGARHYARGHLLQMMYAAEHVEGFSELIEFIGKKKKHRGLWGYLFDNVNMPESPFWGGYWVDSFGPFLGIRY